MTMGTREACKGGDEYDMSSRKARRFVKGRWKPIKQKFWRRVRKLHRLSLIKETQEAENGRSNKKNA